MPVLGIGGWDSFWRDHWRPLRQVADNVQAIDVEGPAIGWRRRHRRPGWLDHLNYAAPEATPRNNRFVVTDALQVPAACTLAGEVKKA
jgi:hypothetical protein